ncbi:hypothetical protein B4U79_10913 [Dinothrombium tinctorium]|uniref:Uncharacterized protein n=1 Tax=Dinothrombium tinctorium TaxID=1965070 RepID=A0A3S3NXE3_9ACAR|nr:hypothetical protein B4U79_10913 [Dinothrombium tinctorium]
MDEDEQMMMINSANKRWNSAYFDAKEEKKSFAVVSFSTNSNSTYCYADNAASRETRKKYWDAWFHDQVLAACDDKLELCLARRKEFVKNASGVDCAFLGQVVHKRLNFQCRNERCINVLFNRNNLCPTQQHRHKERFSVVQPHQPFHSLVVAQTHVVQEVGRELVQILRVAVVGNRFWLK